MQVKFLGLLCIVTLFCGSGVSLAQLEQDSALFSNAQKIFSKNFSDTSSRFLIYSRDVRIASKDFMYKGGRLSFQKESNNYEYIQRYSEAQHNEAYWYEIDLDSLNNSMWYFVNREYDSIGGGSFFKDSSYKIDFIESAKLKFIDSLVVNFKNQDHTIYKFKTLHYIQDSFEICMLHFFSDSVGLIARQSSYWFCTSATNELSPSYEELIEYIDCPYEDWNHFSILNVNDQYYRRKRFLRKPVKEQRPDWIIKALRVGIPEDPRILDFYNDEESCNCSFWDVIDGHLSAIEYGEDRFELTRKEIRKKTRRDIRYFRRLEKDERKAKRSSN